MRRIWIIGFAGLSLATTGINCWGPVPEPKPRTATLRGFGSAEELRKYLVEQANTQMAAQQSYGFWGLGGWFGAVRMDGAPVPAAGMEDSTGTGGNGGQPHSTTNTQEAGVDESDIVKNDGENIYWLTGDTIHIVHAYPPEGLAEVATVKLKSWGDSLYLRGNKLIALSNQYAYYPWRGWGGGPIFAMGGAGTTNAVAEPGVASDKVAAPPSDTSDSTEPSGTGDGSDPATIDIVGGDLNDGGQVTVTVIDVSNPASPVIDATIDLEGQLSTSRLIDNRLHLVLTSVPRIPYLPIPLLLDAMTLDQWLPDYRITTADGTEQTGDMVPWQSFFRPDLGEGYGITTVVTLDVDNPTGPVASSAITADAGTVYASTAALYVTDTEYDWNEYMSRTDTMIHKFALTDTGPEYKASGLVPGRPLNQYSLGEFEGYLRIATTQEEYLPDGEHLSNAVYVLGESGSDLDIAGKIENIAPTERIYAARFVGPRGFLVTFRRVDPLFVIDLHDPANPQIVGELKVPGYSDHIQMMDENHLLTIGKDAQDTGEWAWVEGVQLSIFDVTDTANPQLMYKEVIGGRGTNSEANYNPKAFNYFAAGGVLAFPIDLYSSGTMGPEYGTHEFTGLLVYRVGLDTGFQSLGRISAVDETPTPNGCHWVYYGPNRGVFIGNDVYSVSDAGAKAASLDDVATSLGQAVFENNTSIWEDCYSYAVDPVITLPDGAEDLR